MPIRAGSTKGWDSAGTSRFPGHVPDVLGQRVHSGHHGVDEVGVAAVVIGGVPVGPLPEAAEIGGEDHVAPADELDGVVPVGGVGLVEAADEGLAGAVAVGGQDGGTGAHPAVGDEQVRRHRHGRVGVVDDLVPPVPVAGDALHRLEIERDPIGDRGPSSSAQPGPAADPPLRRGSLPAPPVGVRGSTRRSAWRADHPGVPGREVPRGVRGEVGQCHLARPTLVRAHVRSSGADKGLPLLDHMTQQVPCVIFWLVRAQAEEAGTLLCSLTTSYSLGPAYWPRAEAQGGRVGALEVGDAGHRLHEAAPGQVAPGLLGRGGEQLDPLAPPGRSGPCSSM